MYVCLYMYVYIYILGVDRLSAPILSILPIIDIGHFHFFLMQTNILFTGDIIYLVNK